MNLILIAAMLILAGCSVSKRPIDPPKLNRGEIPLNIPGGIKFVSEPEVKYLFGNATKWKQRPHHWFIPIKVEGAGKNEYRILVADCGGVPPVPPNAAYLGIAPSKSDAMKEALNHLAKVDFQHWVNLSPRRPRGKFAILAKIACGKTDRPSRTDEDSDD